MDWPLTRKPEYFEWAKRAVDELRGVSPTLERAFDDIHASPPNA